MSQRRPEVVHVRSGPVRLAVLDYGNNGSPPLVLLHGIRDLAWSMDSIARAFRADFRVVAPDLRGHGDSDRPGVYTMQHFVADLCAVVHQLELVRPVLVGHSLGGQVIGQYAGIFSESPSACVLIEGLGPPFRDEEGTVEGRRRLARSSVETLAELASEHRPLPDLEAAVERVVSRHPRLEPARARELTAAGTRAHPDGGLQWKWDPAVQAVWSSVSREQNEERWGWVECPVLVVTGATSGEWWQGRASFQGSGIPHGRFPPGELSRRLACFRDASHVEIPAAGHMIHFDQPERLNAAIANFLAERWKRD